MDASQENMGLFDNNRIIVDKGFYKYDPDWWLIVNNLTFVS